MQKGVMMQYFEWNLPSEGTLWKQLKNDAKNLSRKGITAVWIPPACKAFNVNDVGYGIYDLFDLGEFLQKGTIKTKYGTKEELKKAISELHSYNISVYFDAVMNHKAGADYTEKFMVKEVDPNHRDQQISNAYEIEGWTRFDFPARNDKYSAFKWNWHYFTGTDFNQANGKQAIYQIEGKSWNDRVDKEKGNYDYLMYADIDYLNPEVKEHMLQWGIWLSKNLQIDGMRLDAIKHIDYQFIKQFLENIRIQYRKEFYAVGEYWKADINTLSLYLQTVPVDLFDVPLHYNMHTASEQGRNYDLRKIFNETLVKTHPTRSVTFVDNHDSQLGSSLESTVSNWFKPHAYALILLAKDGYPCIFYGDYYGINNSDSPHRSIIDKLLQIRKKHAYGDQIDYFDDPNCIGFVRTGDLHHTGLVLLISNEGEKNKKMYVGKQHAGEIWYEITNNIRKEVTIDKDGNGLFSVEPQYIAVWTKKKNKFWFF